MNRNSQYQYRFYEKDLFVKMSRNLQENTTVGVLFLIALSKKRLRYGCFPINVMKFWRTAALQNTSEKLLLNISGGIYLCKVNIWITRTICDVSDVVLVFLLLTLSRFHLMFCCFYCCLWTSKWWLGKAAFFSLFLSVALSDYIFDLIVVASWDM